LVWHCGSYVPPQILSALHARDCRLHMHGFRLRSLVQQRHIPHAISADDYAPATSPSLYSIFTQVRSFSDDGRDECKIDYNEDALIRMISGAAPRLAHVWLARTIESDTPAHRVALRLGKPHARQSPESSLERLCIPHQNGGLESRGPWPVALPHNTVEPQIWYTFGRNGLAGRFQIPPFPKIGRN
jgi:hypothetical protein